MPDHKITRLVSSQGTTRTLELDDGSIVERHGGTVSWRNNNPGNLKFEFSGSADTTVKNPRTRAQALEAAQGRYRGVVDLDQWGNAVFESYEAGRAAKIQLLTRSHVNHTVEELLPSYSRPDYSGTTHYKRAGRHDFRRGAPPWPAPGRQDGRPDEYRRARGAGRWHPPIRRLARRRSTGHSSADGHA
ncbi:hypothetical protein [Pseudoxanthomonas sp. SORGH_AS_0997]|uniref:hypothetical protein n=1 Tax=Pseudoxanthomonas sp. SORGH_AS_0997 TaxID=3041776 RepID=UPI00286A067D|nr:hypothetical protein [Pseudoxanthomonas sp. SORGH_AS_0997]